MVLQQRSGISVLNFSLCWRRMMTPLIMRLIGWSMERLLASREAGSFSVTPKLETSCSSDSTSCSDSNQPVTGIALKLQSISLPTFGGKYENWANFENIVRHRYNVPWKFDYLLLALKGQALSWFKGLLLQLRITQYLGISWWADTKTRSWLQLLTSDNYWV